MIHFAHIYMFVTLTILLFLIIDSIFLLSWKKYINENNWNNWLYKIPFILSSIVLITLSYYLIKHASIMRYEESEKYYSLIIIFWYLPKVIIVPIILLSKLISKIIKSLKNFANKMNNKNKETIVLEVPDPSRRRLIKTIGWSAASLPFISVADGYARTTNNFRVYKSEIYLSKLPHQFDGLKIVQLSDIHSGSFYSTKPVEEAFSLIPGLKPDLILITGDYVNNSPHELKYTYKSL
jgi:uncharacterized protein